MTKSELFSTVIKEPEAGIKEKSRRYWDALAKPIDGLGVFEDIISRMAAISGKLCPDIGKKAFVIMCADNGVTAEGISQTDKSVTLEVAALLGERKSSIGRMAEGYPVDFYVYDVGIDSEATPGGVTDKKIRRGSADFLKEPAMSEDECFAAVSVGIEAVKSLSDKGYGLIATGEMGIGNTTTSTALLCALLGTDPHEATGRGAGLSDSGLARKIQVIEEGLLLHTDFEVGKEIASRDEVLRALRCVGGLDIAALAGVFIGGAIFHVPIVIDGLISAVAALTADKLLPGCRDYMIPSHVGRERSMEKVMNHLGLRPVISADLALGEGTGALLLLPMLDMAMSLYRDGTAFDDTPIAQYERFER